MKKITLMIAALTLTVAVTSCQKKNLAPQASNSATTPIKNPKDSIKIRRNVAVVELSHSVAPPIKVPKDSIIVRRTIAPQTSNIVSPPIKHPKDSIIIRNISFPKDSLKKDS